MDKIFFPHVQNLTIPYPCTRNENASMHEQLTSKPSENIYINMIVTNFSSHFMVISL